MKKIKLTKLKSFTIEHLKAFLEYPTTEMCCRIGKTLRATPASVYKWQYQGVPVKYWYVLHFKFKMPLVDLLLIDRKIHRRAK